MHRLNVIFNLPTGERLAFTGYVTTRVFSPRKLMAAAFGREFPEGTEVEQFKPAFSTAIR